jgi:hypothetical protein
MTLANNLEQKRDDFIDKFSQIGFSASFWRRIIWSICCFVNRVINPFKQHHFSEQTLRVK